MQDLMFTVGFADRQGVTSAVLLPGDNLAMMEEPSAAAGALCSPMKARLDQPTTLLVPAGFS